MTARSRIAALGVLAVAAAALTGCTAAAHGTTTASTAATSAAKEPLTLYAAVAYDAMVSKAFTAKTGIPVKVVDDSTGPLLTKIAAEKNNPQWSLFWADGATAYASLDQQGLLGSYTPSASYDAVGKSVVPADHSYTPTGVTLVPGLIYNSAKISAPTSYDDLLSSTFKNQGGMNDPAQSGPTYPLIAGLMNQFGGEKNGVAKGEAYLSKLKANGIKVYPTNGDTLHALETGQINYGLIQSSAALGEVLTAKTSATFKPKVVYLSKSTLLPANLAMSKSLDAVQKKEAGEYIDFALSSQGQALMQKADPAGDSLFYPIVSGGTPLPGMTAFPTAYQTIDPKFWGPLQGQVTTWFDSNVK
ncbi:ABC transporter substrate-binding protein [Frondihabitans australicus]|uniref:Iron(III) transport system substrate-binding protein n=1 Tax=Frondihabitans australicus TaxID=386892 RepID=A0A495ID15_9MICO|nr:substrate-binding domain-containing protein [Frondihabitans australicus]RKR73348.1 iron(III) transport system substrate-binding protein [Frondihabitans australicus]